MIISHSEDILLGGIDSIITCMSIIVVFSSSNTLYIPLLLGLTIANTISDGISMFASSYLSKDLSHQKDALTRSMYTWIAFTFTGFLPIIPFILQHLNVINVSKNVMFKTSYVIALCILLIFALYGIDWNTDNITNTNIQVHLVRSILLPTSAIFVAYIIGRQFA